MTVVEYKGYRIEVSSVGRGWRAAILAPGSTRALADSPSNLVASFNQFERDWMIRLGRDSSGGGNHGWKGHYGKEVCGAAEWGGTRTTASNLSVRAKLRRDGF